MPKLLFLDPTVIQVGENVRGEVSDEDAKRMANDLLSAGCQLQPVGVRRNGRGYKLVYGHRRLAGFLWLLRNVELPPDSPLRSVLAVEVTSTEADRLLQVRENAARRNLSPIEQARIIDDLANDDYTVEQIADLFGKSSGWVSQRRALLSLPPDLQKEVGIRISPYHGYLMSRLPEPEARQMAARILCEGTRSLTAGRRNAPAQRRRPTSRDAVRVLKRVSKQVPGAREVLSALIDYLDGKADDNTAQKRLKHLFGGL